MQPLNKLVICENEQQGKNKDKTNIWKWRTSIESNKSYSTIWKSLVFSSTSKSTQQTFAFDCVVLSEHRIDMVNAESIVKKHLNVFITARFIKKTLFLPDSEMKLNLKTFSNSGNPIVCKMNKETVNLKTDVNLFFQLLSVSRGWDVSMQNVLSHEFNAAPQVLFYPNSATRYTSKSNLLNKIGTKGYLSPSLMENPDIAAAVIDLLVSWKYYNLLNTASSKVFLKWPIKFLRNSSQAFVNLKCLL